MTYNKFYFPFLTPALWSKTSKWQKVLTQFKWNKLLCIFVHYNIQTIPSIDALWYDIYCIPDYLAQIPTKDCLTKKTKDKERGTFGYLFEILSPIKGLFISILPRLLHNANHHFMLKPCPFSPGSKIISQSKKW